MIEVYDSRHRGAEPMIGPSTNEQGIGPAALEPAVAPHFQVTLRGYERREVDEYIDYQRHRLAAMRMRAQRAERALVAQRQAASVAVQHPQASVIQLAPIAVAPKANEPEVERLGCSTTGSRRHLPATQRHARERIRQFVRYSACSFVSVALTEVLLYVLYGDLRVASAVECSVVASSAAAVPTFVLFRRYVWRLSGRSRLWGEVIPFCVTTAIGIALATAGVALIVGLLPRLDLHGHLLRAAAVDGASLLAYGVMWLARFVVFDRFVFGRARTTTTLGARAPRIAET